MKRKSQQTPMMEQYNALKEKYTDSILFFRLGDFYEMFNEDALEASKVLEITLTSRNKNAEDPIPMCGVPHHSADQYIKKLVEAGYKVAICEQLEDPKLTKGMVKRDVIKIITPGTFMEDDAVGRKEINYIAGLLVHEEVYYFIYGDISTGDIYLTQSPEWQQIASEIQSLNPAELIVESEQEELRLKLESIYFRTLSSFKPNKDSSDTESLWQLDPISPGQKRVCQLFYSYLQYTQMQRLAYLKPIVRYQLNQFLQMNYFAKKQLELTRSLRSQRKKGSLLWYLDRTKTAMGGRLLSQWLDKPLYDKRALSRRHNKVDYLLKAYFERKELIYKLRDIYDLERLVSKISLGTANARDLDQLRFSLQQIPAINQLLQAINQGQDLSSSQIFEELESFDGLLDLIDQILVDEPPISITEGQLIKPGYHPILDQYRDALDHGQEWLLNLQVREREITGIKTLKVGFNKVFGYYLEVSRLQAQQLNDSRYQRKQTLANSERYFTDELKEMEGKILEAQEKSKQLEYEIFVRLRDRVNQDIVGLQELGRQIAELDVLCNFATLAEEENFVKPVISDEVYDFEIIEARHPVVEELVGTSNFVPNDFTIKDQQTLLLLTGPNMSGKSTYMRQVAFMVILNQIGSFLPAKSARLPLIDRIFTRIGSADDISQGQSTFMVEMMETNFALRNASSRSLLLFDELGRGTATYDGMALAHGILNYIANRIRAVTIFSTHYHELTDLEDDIPALQNIHVGAVEDQGNLVFLHKILEGPADKSYGVHVAKLAGLPGDLIEDSQRQLNRLEKQASNISMTDDPKTLEKSREQENRFIDQGLEEIGQALSDLDLNQLTPLQALNELARLKEFRKMRD